MSRITLTIFPEEHKALQVVAQQERRDPRQEAAWLLRQALEQRALLSPLPDVGGERSRQAKAIEEVQIENSVTSPLLQLATFGQKANVIMRSRIDEARKVILGGRKQAWSRELRVALGNALLSAFVQGFLCEISLATLRPFWITIYAVAGFVGLYLVLSWH